MSTIKNFEELIIWQDARKLVSSIYKEFGKSNDFGFKDQIQRAAVSIMNNIAEGFERESNKDFARFLYIAKASCGEVRSMLYIAGDLQMLDEMIIKSLQSLSRKISVGIFKMICHLRQS